MISRRGFLAAAGGTALGALGVYRFRGGGLKAPAQSGAVAPGTAVTVYKSPSCGCCTSWVEHMQAAGFAVTVHDDPVMDPIKDRLGVPKGVRSCHTAVVRDYLIEGHVPAGDVRRLLAERPAIAGLAVPGMPSHTPGMAPPGEPVGDFAVVSFTRDGATATWARY